MKEASSPDYLADIGYRGRTITFYIKPEDMYYQLTDRIRGIKRWRYRDGIFITRRRHLVVSRSGLVDGKRLSGEEELDTVGRLTDRFEDILPELYKADRTFDISRLFGSWGRGQGQEDKQILGKGSFPVHQVNHVDKCLHLFVIKLACSPQ